jgi:hypothetical protein
MGAKMENLAKFLLGLLLIAAIGCGAINPANIATAVASAPKAPAPAPPAPNPPTPPTPTPAPSSVPSKDPAGIFDGKGGFDAAAYVAMANAYGTPAMIAERFGKPWSAYHSSIPAPTWWSPTQRSYQSPTQSQEQFYYSLGTSCAKDDYSSNYAQVAYPSDPKVAGSAPGVDDIATLEKFSCMWSGQPQPYWATGDGHPSMPLRPRVIQQWDPYGTPQQPVDIARAYGASEAAGCSYMVFQDGQIACGKGGNTVRGLAYFKPFPSNFVPTAASITNNNEFLLVTGWNKNTQQGQLAVLAMGSSTPTGTFWDYEWNELYPGFRNYGIPGFAKLLGIFNLPGMVAPTAIEAVGNWVYQPGAFLPVASGINSSAGQPGAFPLSVAKNWQCFVDSECAQLYDTSGFALIASRYERKVLVLDLHPLFATIQKGMFTSWSEFRVHVANTGSKGGQWPPTFAEDRSSIPRVVKTISYSSEVTAISASLYADNRALIATEDGHVHIWDVDGLQSLTGNGSNAKEIDDLPNVGRNITRITHMKHWDHAANNGGNVRWQYVALSRGDKSVTWIDLSATKPALIRKLQDARMVDPISVEDNNNHGTGSDLIDIADYGDRNIKAYRYGPVTFWTSANKSTFAMGQNGKDQFEYEGSYSTPTGPFAISIENVP